MSWAALKTSHSIYSSKGIRLCQMMPHPNVAEWESYGFTQLLSIHKPATTFHAAHTEVFTLLFPKALLETGTKSTMN